jgi:hypothetical protein
MSRLLLLLAFALVVPTRSAVADYRDDIGRSACGYVAQTVLLGIKTGPNPARNIALCNANEQCLNFKHFIEQYGKTVPSLTCAEAAMSPPAKSNQFKAIFDNACTLVATDILTKAGNGNLQDEIALCNKHPDKQSCLDTKSFIASQRNGDSGGLTCE